MCFVAKNFGGIWTGRVKIPWNESKKALARTTEIMSLAIGSLPKFHLHHCSGQKYTNMHEEVPEQLEELANVMTARVPAAPHAVTLF